MAKKHRLKKSSRLLIVLFVTLGIVGLLFASRGYLAKNFGIEADTAQNEKLLYKKAVSNGDFTKDTFSSTVTLNQSKIILSSGATSGTFSGSVKLPSTAKVSRVILGTQMSSATCTRPSISARFSEDESTFTEFYSVTNSISLPVDNIKARYIQYKVTLTSCSSGTVAIDSLSVLGYSLSETPMPPSPSEPTGEVTPVTPAEPAGTITPPVPGEPTEEATATPTLTPAPTSTVVSAAQIMGNPSESAKTIALSTIQSGISFWALIAIVVAIGGAISIRILKSKD